MSSNDNGSGLPEHYRLAFAVLLKIVITIAVLIGGAVAIIGALQGSAKMVCLGLAVVVGSIVALATGRLPKTWKKFDLF